MTLITKKQSGVTLLELMLALVIGVAILYMGFSQYQQFRSDTNVQELQANVNQIFQAMGLYYKANCFGTFNPSTGKVQPGTLNPDFAGPMALPPNKPINIKTDLVQGGYLPTQLATVVPYNPLVDSKGPGTFGYVAQFNKFTEPRYVCTGTNSGSPAQQGCADTDKVNVGTILIWKPQISILLANPKDADTYKGVLNADCTSRLSDQIVLPCSQNSPGPYLVWERLPSMTDPSNTSSYWQTNHQSAAFTQMYTTYPINYLISKTGSTPYDKQYYLCGG